VDRYSESDRKLFPELERIMRERKVSVTSAANILAEDNKIEGVGSPASRARRLQKLYRKERGAGQ
jgi:hypothetical protein